MAKRDNNPASDQDLDELAGAGGDLGDDPLLELMDEFTGEANTELRVERLAQYEPDNPVPVMLDKPSYCFTVSGGVLSYTQLLDRLRDSCKGGVFKVNLKVDGKWRKKRTVSVDPPATAPGKATGELAQVLERFESMQREQNQRIDKLLTDRQVAPVDPLAQVERLTGIMKNLMPAAPAGAPTDVFGAVNQVLTLADRFAKRGGSGGGSDSESLLEKALGVLAMNMAGSQAAPAAAAAAATPQPATPAPDSQGGVGGQATANTPQAHSVSLMQEIQAMMPDMIQAAADDEDPYVYAYLLLKRVPADMSEDELKGWLAKKNMLLDGLALQYPAAAPHREWFVNVVTEMETMLQPEPTKE